MPVALKSPDFTARSEREKRLLELVPAESLDLDPPHRIANSVVGNLRQRDANLGDPSLGVDRGLCFPHRIPRKIEGDVVTALRRNGVAHRTSRRDAKEVPTQVVVPGIECDRDDVAVDRFIAPRETRTKLRRVGFEHSGAEVDGLPVDENPNIGALGRGLALFRVELREARDRLRRLPRRLVEPAIDRYGAGGHAAGPGDRGWMTEPLARALPGGETGSGGR